MAPGTGLAGGRGMTGSGAAMAMFALLVVGSAESEEGIASCSRHLTSSAEASSRGFCPSWFFKVGSAPCASYKGKGRGMKFSISMQMKLNFTKGTVE